ncbi:PilX N-terminal domain-containing pilus assembly protein [Pseudomonas sp. SCB32]|uniref:pilus assembly PilX family protein n=1 Tax=Pseudomonas sp. SCB32 TaxID=2653853 RepID=UPI00211569D0|nr:PilX N-terminal domain-containing pilus assembly protein [Pseudomonas sp. SCB32]
MLLVALIMLLLLTIIGISSMRSTTMQERMAGNLRDESHALQSAEAAMRQGEAAVKAQSVTHWQDYVSSSSWDNASDISGLTTPQYRLTTLPGVTIVKAGSSLEAGAPITVAVVRVEAHGFGAVQGSDGNAATTYQLKSMYIKR